MAHRTVSLLRGTPLGSRVDVEAQGSCEYQAEPTATCDTMPDGTVALALRGSDRRVTIRVSRVDTIDDIAIIKNVADLLQAAVMRTSDASQDDDDLDLWPKAAIASDEDPVFRSPRMVELLKIATRLAATDLPVLITGETGTGKEIIARLIHEHSRSRRGPFVPFNCSSIARDLVESQLFGHRRGAFTGAHETFGGVIRSAERGTLFLDEVGDLDPSVQPKLLRFLEHGEVHAVGESRPQTVSVRLVAATNADLEALIHQGRFRSDLYYRLGVTKLVLPPLRERKDEIPALASRFVARSARECGRLGLRLGDDFLAALLLYDWPGNIRELVNEIRRVVALAADGDVLSAQQLSPAIASRWRSRPSPHVEPLPSGLYVRLDQTLAQAVNQVEEQFIERALGVTGGRVAEAAQLLGLSRKGLFLKRRRRRMVTATDIDGRQRA
jgi:DNA-binding NtrC family response regulator